MLTTITPCWGRPLILRTWLAALAGATCARVQHLVYFIGEYVPLELIRWQKDHPNFHFYSFSHDTPGHYSIGHYHNLGAWEAKTEWIMKLDVDALPNVNYFKALLALLPATPPRQWWNGGMVYLTQAAAEQFLALPTLPLRPEPYVRLLANQRTFCSPYTAGPAATNFICRRLEYLALGGGDERFRGYGWEDYQQVYMLEAFARGADPLPGPLTLTNVTQRCRDELSRPKARELYARSSWLCLCHHYHPRPGDERYRSAEKMNQNRRVLFDYIMEKRKAFVCP